jgi:ABC-type microcin C transport system permease subunit YejB
MNTEKIKQYIFKLKNSFLEETDENKKMLDTYINFIDGKASASEIEEANYQLKQIFKSLGLGFLVLLPFSPISIPYVMKKAKEYEIDLIPDWYKALSKDEDRLE